MMSGGDVRKVSRQDIQLVQNLIERCLQLYMSQKEVVDTLLQQAKIEPGFTELVWQKLEEENQEFFRAYHLRLIVKDQILRFNELLERQAEHMHLIHPPRITSISGSNGSQMTSMPQNSVSVSEHARPVVKEETLHQNVSGGLTTYNSNGNPTTYSNGNPNPPLQPPHMHTVMDMSSAHALSMNNTSNMLMPPHSSNVAMLQTMNGGGRMIKSEVNYPGNAPFVFGGPHGGSVLDTQHTIGDTNVSSFNEPSSIPLPDSLLDSTETSFGLLGQIPRNFSLSDLSADFSNSNDILETYPRSPFMATDLDFIDPSGRR